MYYYRTEIKHTNSLIYSFNLHLIVARRASYQIFHLTSEKSNKSAMKIKTYLCSKDSKNI